MRTTLLIATATLALAACGQKTSTTTTTDSNGTATTSTTTTSDTIPSAQSLGIQPGQWETVITITDLKMDGMPPGMTPPKPEPTKVITCLSPEQAAKGPGDFLKASGGQCTATTNNFGGGKIDVAMTCKMPMGTMTTRSTGSYTPTTMTSDAEATVTGKMSMTQKIHTQAHRIGDCPG